MAKSRKKAGPAVASGEASDSGLAVFSQSAGNTIAGNIDRAQVARRAYELYLERGATDGRDMDDWFTAERELAGSGYRTSEGR